jgi:hypothetical protein
MISRLMDLVMLLAERDEEDDRFGIKSNREFFLKQYTDEEIEQALSWISSKQELVRSNPGNLYAVGSLRVLSEWERVAIGDQACTYLLKLLNLGIVDGYQMEKILALLCLRDRRDLDEVKALACSVIFELQEDEDEGLFNDGVDRTDVN